MSDLERLRERAIAGDAAALNALCQALAPAIFGLCLRMLGRPSDAEDATQDVLVKVVTHLSQFEGRSSLRTWAHTIAVRHVLATKKSKAELHALDEAGFDALLERGLALSGAQPPATPEELVQIREVRMTCTQGMLLILAREERLAIVLVELLGFDSAEAAEIAGVSHDAFRQRLARARTRLGDYLQSRCGVVNEQAACSCEKQVAAKRGRPLTLSPLFTATAQRELRQVSVIARTFHMDGEVVAPRALLDRIAAQLPSVLKN
jgi:RNA polymerase sigma factor (sigma-70 family)